MADSIISALREYLGSCPLLSEAPCGRGYIDWTDADNVNYGIFPDGDRVIRKFLNGSGKHCYNFSVYFNRVTAEDNSRLANQGYMEKLRDYFTKASVEKKLPQLPKGKTAQSLEAMNGQLVDMTKKYGKYVIQFKLYYTG